MTLSHLVEAEHVDSAAHVDTVRTDTVHALTSQPFLRKHYPSSHCSRKCWRHDDRHQVKGSHDHEFRIVATTDLRKCNNNHLAYIYQISAVCATQKQNLECVTIMSVCVCVHA